MCEGEDGQCDRRSVGKVVRCGRGWAQCEGGCVGEMGECLVQGKGQSMREESSPQHTLSVPRS